MATVPITKSDFHDLRETVAGLQQRVQSLECRLDSVVNGSNLIPDIRGFEAEITRLTNELFPGEATIKVTADPEFPQDSYTVVHAQASGKIEDIEDRRIQWHQRVVQISESCRLLRLSLQYQS